MYLPDIKKTVCFVCMLGGFYPVMCRDICCSLRVRLDLEKALTISYVHILIEIQEKLVKYFQKRLFHQ
jgi:hypothetical protein